MEKPERPHFGEVPLHDSNPTEWWYRWAVHVMKYYLLGYRAYGQPPTDMRERYGTRDEVKVAGMVLAERGKHESESESE